MLGCYPLFPLGWDGRPLAGEWDIRVTPGHNEDQLQTNLEICAKTKLVTFFFFLKKGISGDRCVFIKFIFTL